MTGPAPSAARDDRRAFLESRRRALRASGGAVAALGVLAALFVAPNRLASLQVGGVALAWWVAGAAALAGLVALGHGFRESGVPAVTPRTSPLGPLALAAVWSSPALWLGLPPLVLADGTRGLWTPAVVVGGAVVALLLLGTSWSRTGGLGAPASALARARWPSARGGHALLVAIELFVAGLFVWAQLAAAREVGTMAGWPRLATVGVTGLIVVALCLPELARARLTGVGAGLALAGLAAPLLVIALGTTTAWPFVWNAVASRARIGFGEGSRWTGEGGAVRGPTPTLALRFADEQRVTFGARGSVVIEPREGGRLPREVDRGDEIALHPGDRLVLPGGFPLRFEAGRRVPDAPDSGPDWVEPPSRPAGWLWLTVFGVTGVLGALGLPTGAGLEGTGRLSPAWCARLAAILVAAGVALAVGWSLYAAWLTPEVYVGGVAGAEVYALPGSLPRPTASLLTWLVLGGLALGSIAAALGSLRGLVDGPGPASGGRRWVLAPALVALAGALACLTSVGAWPLLLWALGLAASALAPAAVLACWSERATARGTVGGAGAGLAAFLLLVAAGALGPAEPPDVWATVALAAPAVVAVPLHLLVAWIARARAVPSARSPLPPGLESLADALPARPRSG